MGGNTQVELANPEFFAGKLSKIHIEITLSEYIAIKGLPFMEQLDAMQAISDDDKKALSRIQKVCQHEIDLLLSHYTPSTVSSLLSRYKTVLSDMGYSDHVYSCFFKLPLELQKQLKTEYAHKVAEENRNLRAFYFNNEYISHAEDLIQANSYIKKAAGLMALTGRRPSEIFLTAQFKPIADSNHEVSFSGQLKKKKSAVTRENAYVIPILTDANLVISALESLRTQKDFSDMYIPPGKTHCQAINQVTAKAINDVVRKQFGRYFQGRITAYALRPAYALVCVHMFKPETVTNRAYIAKLLGHSNDDTATAASYEDFYLAKPL